MRRSAMKMMSAPWRRVRWLGLCLFLLVAACSNAPTPSSVTSTASEPTQVAAITAYHGHTSTVFAVAWSPDGRRIASGSDDSTVQIWDANSGHLLLTYSGHTAGVRALAWSPDGTRIVSGGNDNTIQVWNATTRQRLVTYTAHLGSIWAVAWSPEGKRIASGGNDSTVQVWDAKSGRRLLTYPGHAAPVRAVAWSHDGTRIASATGNDSYEYPKETVQVWNAMTGQTLRSYPVPSSAGYVDGTLSMAWSPDGTHLASGGADTIVHLWTAPALCKRFGT